MLNNFEIKLLNDTTLSKREFTTDLRRFAEYANEEQLFNNLRTLLVITNIESDQFALFTKNN